MARTELTPKDITPTGVNGASTTGTVDGHLFANNGRCIIMVTNGNAATRVLTIPTQATHNGRAVADDTVTCAASGTNGGRTFIGPFAPALFNVQGGADDGKMYLNFPGGQETDLSVIVLRIP